MTRKTTWFMTYDEVKEMSIRLDIELLEFTDGSYEAHAIIEEMAENWDEPRYHFYDDCDIRNAKKAEKFVSDAIRWGKRYGMEDNDFVNVIWSVKEGS